MRRAAAPSPTSQINDTGSKRAIALVTAAHTLRYSPSSPSGSEPNVVLAGGNSIQVRSWRTHSGGIENPVGGGPVVIRQLSQEVQPAQ